MFDTYNVDNAGPTIPKVICKCVRNKSRSRDSWQCRTNSIVSLSHREDFNVLLYGVGSKAALLEEFCSECLSEEDHLVVRGYMPNITIRTVREANYFSLFGLIFPFSNERSTYKKDKLRLDHINRICTLV